MANPVPAGSDVSAGTYRCTNCSNEIQVGIHPTPSTLPGVQQRLIRDRHRGRQHSRPIPRARRGTEDAMTGRVASAETESTQPARSP
jgi:hypothetical protein